MNDDDFRMLQVELEMGKIKADEEREILKSKTGRQILDEAYQNPGTLENANYLYHVLKILDRSQDLPIDVILAKLLITFIEEAETKKKELYEIAMTNANAFGVGRFIVPDKE